MFHVELRQSIHITRAFNLSEAELNRRFVQPWTAGVAIASGDRDWDPKRCRITVYEGPELRPDQIGMGRGWSNVTRGGEDVTEQVVGAARQRTDRDPLLDWVKERMAGHLGVAPLALREAVAAAAAVAPGRRASEHLALAELAAWELLHLGEAELVEDGAGPVAKERWEELLMSWPSWTESSGLLLR